MPIAHWLVKQEPETYPWSVFVKDGGTAWTGVRSFPARNHLRAMKRGDLVLYYHSVSDKQIVGVARVAKEAYADPTATEGDWSAVDLKPVQPLARPVTLDQLKADSVTNDMPFLRQTRLSVAPLTPGQFARVLELAATSPRT